MQNLKYVFGLGVAGVALCLVMTVVTAVGEHRAASAPQPRTIPLPAAAPANP